MDTATEISSYLSCQNLPAQILGTQLGALVRIRFPEFAPENYGCRNLRHFLDKYAPDFHLVGQRGMDYVYSKRTTVTAPQPQTWLNPAAEPKYLTAEANIWKTFTSPNSIYKLFANRNTGELCVQPPYSEPLLEPWHLIPGCTAEKHLEIARAFIDTILETEKKNLLVACLDQPNWWLQFYQTAQRIGVLNPWLRFRRRRILEEFEATLVKLSIPLTHLSRLTFAIPSNQPHQADDSKPTSIPEDTNDREDRLRKFAVALINRLSMAELREIRVRLGDVFDEL